AIALPQCSRTHLHLRIRIHPNPKPDPNPTPPPLISPPLPIPAFESSAPDFTSPSRFNSLDELTHDLGSLHELSTRGSWEAILDKISQTRALFLLAKPHEHLTYLTYQVMALTKLRRSDEASRELTALHDFDDGAHYRYESHPEIYPNRKGSLVPFALRWLHALIPTRIGNRLEWLYTLLDFVRGRIREKGDDCSVELCKKRERFVMSCLLGFHLGHKEFGVSLELIKELIKRDPLDHVLVSKLGYVQMQFGDVEGAKATFNRIEKSNENLVGRNKALVHVVAKDYAAAGSVRCDQGDGECVGESADRVVVNLCSMYELAYVNHTDAKRTLNTWITRVAPDDFDSSCTRISGIVYMLFRSWIFPLSNVMITWMDILRSSTRSS
ncbi:hypothetical protein HID58_000086, partial [Brassica napus]